MNLNIRDIDKTLVTKLKREALDAGVTLRTLVILKLSVPLVPEVTEVIEVTPVKSVASDTQPVRERKYEKDGDGNGEGMPF